MTLMIPAWAYVVIIVVNLVWACGFAIRVGRNNLGGDWVCIVANMAVVLLCSLTLLVRATICQ